MIWVGIRADEEMTDPKVMAVLRRWWIEFDVELMAKRTGANRIERMKKPSDYLVNASRHLAPTNTWLECVIRAGCLCKPKRRMETKSTKNATQPMQCWRKQTNAKRKLIVTAGTAIVHTKWAHQLEFANDLFLLLAGSIAGIIAAHRDEWDPPRWPSSNSIQRQLHCQFFAYFFFVSFVSFFGLLFCDSIKNFNWKFSERRPIRVLLHERLICCFMSRPIYHFFKLDFSFEATLSTGRFRAINIPFWHFSHLPAKWSGLGKGTSQSLIRELVQFIKNAFQS